MSQAQPTQRNSSAISFQKDYVPKPLADGINIMHGVGGLPVFLPSEEGYVEPRCWQSEILQRRVHVHVNMHYCAIFMHSAYVYMHVYALCGYTCQPAQWHLSSCCYCRQSYPGNFN